MMSGEQVRAWYPGAIAIRHPAWPCQNERTMCGPHRLELLRRLLRHLEGGA